MSALGIQLAVLREWWGSYYEITWDCRGRVFRAVSRDCRTVLEHAEPEGLWQQLRADHITRPEDPSCFL